MSVQRNRESLPNIHTLHNSSYLKNNISLLHNHHRSANSMHILSSLNSFTSNESLTDRGARSRRSQSPSCKKMVAQTLSKRKMPISKLTVVQYKDLLSQPDNDPKNPDISMHIPVDNDETKFFLNNTGTQIHPSGNPQLLEKQKTNIEEKTNPQEVITYSNLLAAFIPFKNSKEINKHEFLRLHSENPTFTSLDFRQLYPGGQTTKLPQLNNNEPAKGETNEQANKQIDSGTATNTNKENKLAESAQKVLQHKKSAILIDNKTNSLNESTHLSSFEKPKTQRDRSTVELSLVHNKDILDSISSNLLLESQESYENISNMLRIQQQLLKNMPAIRQYPIFKKKSVPAQNQTTTVKKGISKGSSRQIGPIETDTSKKEQPEEDKKVRFTSNPGTDKYQVYWYAFEQNNWKPEIRELQTMVLDQKKAFIFGGVGKELYNQLFELDLESAKWKEIKGEQVAGNVPCARFGHSCNMFKRNIVIFGGEYRPAQGQSRFKDCLLDVYIFNLDSQQWRILTCSGGPPQARKSHASVIIGRNLIIHGGFNNKDQAIKDMWILDLGTLVWNEAETNGEVELGFHKCSPVYHSQRCGKVNLYKFIDIKITKWGANIEQEGLYFFGGKNTKGEILGDLKILKTDCKPMQWIVPETKGIPPKPRYSHSMDYAQELNFLVIYGGKNDLEMDVYFGDLNLLNLDDFTWINVITHGKIQPPRANHSSCIYDSKLVIFGGINLDGFMPPIINILELDNILSSKMDQRDQSNAFGRISLTNSSMKQSQQFSSPGKKSIKNSQLNPLESNFRFDNIPFNDKVQDQEIDNKTLVNNLNFNNFKSFLPVPRYARQPTKKNTFFKQPIQYNSKTNTAISPSSDQKPPLQYE